MGRSTECILGTDVEAIFGCIFGSRWDALMSAFLGWAVKLDLRFLLALCACSTECIWGGANLEA